MNNITFMTAQELAIAIRQRQVSAVEVVEAYLTQITQHNPKLNAIVTLDEDGARRRAQEADSALARGEVWVRSMAYQSHWKTYMLQRIFDLPAAAILH